MVGGLSVKMRWSLGLGACALLGAGIYLARAPRGHTNAVAPSAARMAPSASVARAPHRPMPAAPRWPFEDPSTPAVVPVQTPEVAEDGRFRTLPQELRRAARLKQAPGGPGGPSRRSRYPADCRPASEALRRVLPHNVAPHVRPLSPAPLEVGRALLRATQDRDHLLPGETALLTVEVAIDGQRAPFEVKDGALLHQETTPGAKLETLASVAFRDDGVAPDEAAKDGVATARAGVPAGHHDYSGELRVRATVSTASEIGEVVFPLVATPAPPAAFTGAVREVMENGSLAFYASIRVAKAGRYDFVGRVYDSERRAMAVLITNGNFDTTSREVRLALCGKLVRDENVPGPWELRDLEGFLFSEVAGRADRLPMAQWSGPHRTRVYALDSFSDDVAEKPGPPAP